MNAQSCIALAIFAVFPLSVALFNRSELERRLKDSQAELDKLKSLDRITGVANRKRFDLVLSREWQRATRDPKPISLLLIDTDFFDLYNEHYGPHAGDACLRLIASKLAGQPHRHYDLVSRFEGGRFSVLLPGASGDAVKRIAEDLRAEIAALDWPHERSQFGRVTVSVGWASMLPETGLATDRLFSAAEAALTVAKKKGKNRVEGFASNVVAMPGAAR
jgi:diguanylate cyclase (GGDEF)-like protein